MKRTQALREIRESSEEELRGRLDRLEKQLFQFRLKHATNQIENVSQIRTTRREIARVLCVIGERRQAKAQPQAQAKKA